MTVVSFRKIFGTITVVCLCLCFAVYYGWLGISLGPPLPSRLLAGTEEQQFFPRFFHDCASLQRLSAWNAPATGEDPKPLTILQPTLEKNCSLLRAGDVEEVRRVKQRLKTWNDSEAQEQFSLWISGDCPSIVRVFSNNFYVSQEELDFPVAFTMLVYTNPVQVVRLLRTIYRPHNLYCIHPDGKQSTYFISVFRKLAECLDNVIVGSNLQEVYWGYHTIMEAELSCMYDLLHFEGHQWKYIINIGGQELPLKTNREIVAALRGIEGASSVIARPFKDYNRRFVKLVKLIRKKVVKTKAKLPPVPHDIKLYKGAHFFSITRNFTEFILSNGKAVDFREYMKEVYIPEEEFYASLYMLPEAPVKRLPEKNMPLVDRSFWDPDTQKHCTGGIFVRDVCIVGVSELYNIHLMGVKKQVFFMNKYHSEKDHVVMDCMEEWLLRQNAIEFVQDMCS